MDLFSKAQKRNEKLVNKFINKFNDRKMSDFVQEFHEDIELGMFSVLEAKAYNLKGIETIINTFEAGVQSSDFKITIIEIISQNNRCVARLKMSGTNWKFPSGFEIKESFEYEIVYFISFKDNKIIKMEQIQDTFKILQLIGRASLKSNNKQIVENYMETLNRIGIFSDKMRSKVS